MAMELSRLLDNGMSQTLFPYSGVIVTKLLGHSKFPLIEIPPLSELLFWQVHRRGNKEAVLGISLHCSMDA